MTKVAAPRTRKRAVIIVAAASTCATSVAAQDVYIVPRHEGVISRLFRMQRRAMPRPTSRPF